ncbi:MAG: hypothetical protein IKX99_05275 [Lachnospiraceae bacterium]|nr:hypothetical protein [Lachnospiraceae bacterium]
MKKKSITILLLCIALLITGCGINAEKAPAAKADFPCKIYICGELHHMDIFWDKELELWDNFYKMGARHLFLELSYATVVGLNEFMKSDTDGISESSEFYELSHYFTFDKEANYFYFTIKEKYPETIFHSIDIAHDYEYLSADYKNILERNGKADTEDYQILCENIEQGRIVAELDASGDEASGWNYREEYMFQNFVREYEAIKGEFVMAIVGGAHANENITTAAFGGHGDNGRGEDTLITRIKSKYDSVIGKFAIWNDPVSTEKMTVAGKEYDAVYYGSLASTVDFLFPSARIANIDAWWLKNAYEDFSSKPTNYYLSFDQYRLPMEIKANEVYVLDITYQNGETERKYYLSSGEMTDGSLCINPFDLE